MCENYARLSPAMWTFFRFGSKSPDYLSEICDIIMKYTRESPAIWTFLIISGLFYRVVQKVQILGET